MSLLDPPPPRPPGYELPEADLVHKQTSVIVWS